MIITNLRATVCEQFCEDKRGASMNYLAAIFCVIALVLINIFGKESNDVNSILSAAIMACIWGGRQRTIEHDKKPTPRRRASDKDKEL